MKGGDIIEQQQQHGILASCAHLKAIFDQSESLICITAASSRFPSHGKQVNVLFSTEIIVCLNLGLLHSGSRLYDGTLMYHVILSIGAVQLTVIRGYLCLQADVCMELSYGW